MQVAALLAWSVTSCVPAPPRGPAAGPPTPPVEARIRAILEAANAGGVFPGIVAGIVLPDGRSISVASGMADTARLERMTANHRMLAGSVGKTFVAAVALQLVAESRLSLDDLVSVHVGGHPWFFRLPNAATMRVRHLMNHTSGLVRYELNPRFIADLSSAPLRTWTPLDRLAYLFDSAAPFPAGGGWEYSDTNYILLGMILERATGRDLYDEVEQRVLRPHGLAGVVPSAHPRIAGLSQGYAGPDNPFGGSDAMLVDGSMVINPQFEWAGGGFATTAEDLARWARLLYDGAVVPLALRDSAVAAAVPATPLGPDVSYGLGVIIRTTPLGVSWGHSGFMPGYLTELRYWPDHGIAVAVQVNATTRGALGRSPGAIAVDIATALIHP